jgi:hypothetical protein
MPLSLVCELFLSQACAHLDAASLLLQHCTSGESTHATLCSRIAEDILGKRVKAPKQVHAKEGVCSPWKDRKQT